MGDWRLWPFPPYQPVPWLRVCIVALALVILVLSVRCSHAASLSVAKQYVGLHERTHRASLRKIVGVDPARVPWCGYFVAAVAKRVGRRPPPGYGRAISWRSWGKAVTLRAARPGDVVVMRRHVTIFTRKSGGKVCGIGGNQGNRVRESCYSAGKIIAVRR